MTQTQILGPGGEQLTEVDWSGSTMSNWHTDIYTAGGVAGSYSLNQDPETSTSQPTVLNFYLTDWLGTRAGGPRLRDAQLITN